jgi:hypothetical protein
VYAPKQLQILRQGPSNEVIEVGQTCMHDGDLDIRPPATLKYNPTSIWYTDGSKQTIEGTDTIGAGTFCASENARLRVNGEVDCELYS